MAARKISLDTSRGFCDSLAPLLPLGTESVSRGVYLVLVRHGGRTVKRALWIASCMVGLCLIESSSADAASWWPWSSTKTTTTARTFGPPMSGGKPVVTQASTSTWSKITSGTKKAVTTTVDVVTLKPLRDKWSKPAAPATSTAKPKSSSGWNSWFKPKEEKKISTVSEWMAQPRPKY